MAQKIEYPKNLAPKVDDLAPEPQGEPTDARWIDEIETKALAQVASNARMVEIGEGVVGLCVRHPRMFKDLRAWKDASENDHADTVLRLIAALRAAGGVQGSAKLSGNSVEGERWRAAALAVQEEGEWEYGHECDESREAYPEERPAINDWPVTPDCQNAVVYRRTKAVPAGEWLPVEQEGGA